MNSTSSAICSKVAAVGIAKHLAQRVAIRESHRFAIHEPERLALCVAELVAVGKPERQPISIAKRVALDQPERARAVIEALRRKMRQANEHIEGAVLRRRQRLGTTRLLEAALSAEGPVFPRSGDTAPPKLDD